MQDAVLVHSDVMTLDRLSQCSDAFLAGLRDALRRIRYEAALIMEAERRASGQVDLLRLPLVQDWLEHRGNRGDVSAHAALLFAYRGAVRRTVADSMLGPALAEEGIRLGLLREEGQRVTSNLRLMPFEDLLILGDELSSDQDPVMGPGRTTARLARWMGDVSGRTVLDVGCGAGSLGLLAARRGAFRVVAVDLSARAVALTKINARLNDLPIDARVGDLFAPVDGEAFDLIVAQPPFVLQPDDVPHLTFLHGGEDGDELTLRLLAELEPHLSPCGRALVSFQAPLRPSDPLIARVGRALSATSLSCALSILGYVEADALAIVTAAETSPAFGEEYGRRAKSYRQALSSREIHRVVDALADVRFAPGRTFASAFHWSAHEAPAPRHLEEAWQTAHVLDPRLLMDAPLRLRQPCVIRMDQTLGGTATGDARQPDPTKTVVVEAAPVRAIEANDEVVALLAAIDAHGSLRAALSALTPKEDVPEVAARALPIVADLISRGVMVTHAPGHHSRSEDAHPERMGS